MKLVLEAKTTASATAATKIKVGKPAVKTALGLPMIDVEVTNGDASSHSFTVQAAFLKGDELAGILLGAVNDLTAGATKTASLMGTGEISGYGRILLAVDALVK
ncbi:MAG: hypothetical protein HYY04_00105 [Chloroflexi bacterium]|nr:hypothetical protein [Chloroflexota bacterium]